MIHGLQASWLLQVYVYVYMLCRLLVIEQVQPVGVYHATVWLQ